MGADLDRARQGDRAAVGALLRELLPDVRRKLWRYVRVEADVDDLTQLVLIEVARRISTFRGESSVRTWAWRICVRMAFRHLERQGRVIPFPPAFEPSDEGMGAARIDARDGLRELERALGGLSAERRMVYVLMEVEGHTAPEVAEMLDLPLGTVYGRQRDARIAVDRALGRDGAVLRRAR